jgi:hypothetical protein
LPAKATIAQQEVFAGVMKTLDENWGFNSVVKLVAKHVLLTIVVSVHSSSSTRMLQKPLVSTIETRMQLFQSKTW